MSTDLKKIRLLADFTQEELEEVRKIARKEQIKAPQWWPSSTSAYGHGNRPPAEIYERRLRRLEEFPGRRKIISFGTPCLSAVTWSPSPEQSAPGSFPDGN